MRFSDCEQSVRRTLLLSLIFLVLSAQALLPVDDPDIWWRLKLGEWMASHHAVLYADHFSAVDIGKPWIEYSWLFSLLVYWIHAQMGLVGLVYFMVLMALALTYGAYRLIRGAGLPVYVQVAVIAIALATIKSLMTPRPWLVTILFFEVELFIIYRARRTENDDLLWFLPILFVAWANFHIQFVYGLAVVGLLLGEALFGRWARSYGWNLTMTSLSLRTLTLVTLACLGATFLTPYHFLLYEQVFAYIFVQVGAFQMVSELHPMFFRSVGDWLVLAMTIFAAYALGWQRKWSPFSTALLLIAAFVGYRARRDVWMIALASLAIFRDAASEFVPSKESNLGRPPLWRAILLALFALYFMIHYRGIDETKLQTVVREKFPVAAVDYVKKNQLSGPLFNDFDWGGFLIWSLPEIPVSMDGRTGLYGDRRIERSLETWNGAPGWEADPDLRKAKLVIADRERALTRLLRMQPAFKVVFEDDTAVVFVRVG